MENDNKKELILFGRDVSQIPCFRNSFVYGITGGLSFGILHFLFNSKPVKAANFSVYSFSLITIAYWIQCRYNYSKAKFEMLQLQEKMRQHALLEGTQDPEVAKQLNVDVVEV